MAKKQCDIVFVLRPSGFGEFVPFPEMALTAYVKSVGFNAAIIDPGPTVKHSFMLNQYSYDEYFEFVKKKIQHLKPRFIGMGTFTSDYDFVMRFAKDIKAFSDAKFIVGNIQATLMPKDFIFEGSPVDIAVSGEGELTLEELLKAPDQKPDTLKKIRSICFLDNDKKTPIRTPIRDLIRDLSILPIPAYEDIDMDYYVSPKKRVIGHAYYSVIPIYTGRGCPFRCRFCAAATVWGERSVRELTIDRTIDEIKLLVKKYHVDAIYVIDDTFTVQKPRVLEFCSKIKPIGIAWAAQTRVNCIDEELIKAMKDAGCIQLTFGVETGSQKLLNLMHKGSTNEQVKKAFALCKKYKVRTFANMMFNLPEEDEEDVKMSYEIYKEISPDDFGVGLTVAYPGTEIYEKYFPQKLTKDEYHLLAEARGYGGGRFKLCKHNLNLNELLADFRMNWDYQHIFPLFMRVLISPSYLKMIVKSKHRKQYISCISRDLHTGFIRAGGTIAYNLMRPLPTRVRAKIVSLATVYGRRFGN